jgi:hypothetical protein
VEQRCLKILGPQQYALQVFLNINGKRDDPIQAVENQSSAEER